MRYGMKQKQKDYKIQKKGVSFYPLFWFFIFFSIIFSACGDDKNQEIEQKQDLNKYLVSVGNTLHFDRTAMVKKLSDMNFGQFSSYVPSNREISMNVVNYLTKDPRGKEVTASGIITYPSDNQFKGVVVSMHYTITKSDEAPSVALFTPESLLAFRGYLVISPDFIGFGSTSNLVHPYLHEHVHPLHQSIFFEFVHKYVYRSEEYLVPASLLFYLVEAVSSSCKAFQE